MGPIRKNIYNPVAISILVFLIVFGNINLQAQQVIDASGGQATGSQGTSSYSVGQVFYNFIAAPGGMQNQGVQQPVDYNPLPVTLISFEVKSEKEQVLVHWQTTAEINNDFFTVERSNNSFKFEEIHRVNGSANSNSITEYSWTDPFPQMGINYYRLKQTDFDNAFTYSTIRAVNVQSLHSVLDVFPNPVSDYLILKDAGQSAGRSYKIFDMNGKLVESQVLKEGEQKIDMTHLSPAVYVVQFTTATEVQKIKIIKN